MASIPNLSMMMKMENLKMNRFIDFLMKPWKLFTRGQQIQDHFKLRILISKFGAKICMVSLLLKVMMIRGGMKSYQTMRE